MTTLVTAESLQDVATLIGAVVVLVQFFKGAVDTVAARVFRSGIATRYVAYFFSVLLLLFRSYATGTLTPGSLPLVLVNGVVVALAAMKAYEEFARAGAPASPHDANR